MRADSIWVNSNSCPSRAELAAANLRSGMKRTLYVISDLHLGGAEGYQMCAAAGQARLTEFIQYLTAKEGQGEQIHLILNGDVVDFLAEREFASFTCND